VRALYCLGTHIASFDFYNWLVLAKAGGARSVVFRASRVKTNKWSHDDVLRRFRTILEPGPALAGLPSSVGEEGRMDRQPSMAVLVRRCREGMRVEKLKSVLPAGTARYTVTLRTGQRREERNSNEAAWRTFAAEIGAVVIEDYDVKPIGLHERVALYDGAEMNFGVTNGPMHLCSLTSYPLAMFACNHAAGAFANCGMAFGEQYPWAGPGQHLVWESDTLDNLRRWFEAWSERRNRQD
jgi:hypothetical protein